ncbi:hypothetical protein QFC19_009101 [Naganishia cerealis]|uniref:Uncharacterized protein n=1 Tax=Naganishia cerealis TaxID=610337 RepID=A0ACC2UX86_9TREE|nr:hypothetical protein QFC19_009101 [Naganishia cerealis]
MNDFETVPAVADRKSSSEASSSTDVIQGGTFQDPSANETATVIAPDPDNQLHNPHPPKTLDNGQKIDAEHPLWDDLCPEDSYVDGVYWADLSRAHRGRWAIRQANEEAVRELKHIGGMFKKDPLSPIRSYFSRYVLGGFGLFTEGYTLFSIGNLTPLFKQVWPQCWSTFKVCDENWIAAQTYLQILGIIIGQIGVGFEGDWIGRKAGLVQDALIMFLGLVMLTAMWGTSLNGWVICYGWSLFIYGFGVGGEYPMTSSTAMEYKAKGGSAAINQRDDKLHRGRNVVLAFLMQGWGQMFNQVVLIVLLLIFHGGGNPPYGKTSAQWTFRVQFGIMAAMTLWLVYYRYYRMHYSSAALKKSKKNARVNQSGYDVQSLKLVFSHFGGRIIATAGTWFANDFAFYGNKLFQSTFIKVLYPDSKGVMTGWLWNLVNIGVALVGYYMAALLIDHKLYGRQRMQCVGFFFNFLLFLLPAVLYDYLREPAHIHGFQAIYFLSGFFQQFGPNCTTFLIAAEVFPISVRATAHGFSAACGKLGALAPAVLYNYIDDRTKFWVVCWFGLGGLILSAVFLADTTGLDLREQERYWSYVRQGRAHEYCGIAVHPRHLSMWEKVVLKRHLAYDPDLDRMMKLSELRQEYLAHVHAEPEDAIEQEHAEMVMSSKASAYFANETKQTSPGDFKNGKDQ